MQYIFTNKFLKFFRWDCAWKKKENKRKKLHVATLMGVYKKATSWFHIIKSDSFPILTAKLLRSFIFFFSLHLQRNPIETKAWMKTFAKFLIFIHSFIQIYWIFFYFLCNVFNWTDTWFLLPAGQILQNSVCLHSEKKNSINLIT